VPAGWDGKTPLKVMYYLNGIAPKGKEEESFTGLSQLADKDHFMLVYLNGDGRNETYNNGQTAFNDGKPESYQNDYLNAIKTQLGQKFPLDAKYQGLVGFSEGGSEALDLASKNAWVSSVQTVEGYMTGLEAPLTRPLSAQFIHDALDPVVPIGGTKEYYDYAMSHTGVLGLTSLGALIVGEYESHKGDFIEPESYAVNTYTSADKTGPGVTKTFDDNSPSGSAIDKVRDWLSSHFLPAPLAPSDKSYSTTDYVSQSTGVEVKAITLNSGTHAWAGSNDHSGDIAIIGVPSAQYEDPKDPNDPKNPKDSFNASQSIATFFEEHPNGG
jgi:poly(3-hydroxybutyrate) depolymerase